MAPAGDADELLLRSRVPASANGHRLLDYLSARFRYHDRQRWRQEIEDHRLTIDDEPAEVDDRVRVGALVCYQKHHVEPAVNRDFGVVHVEPAFLAIDKPAHLPMHADGPFVRNTLVSLVRQHFDTSELYPVHRLDRETSGLTLFARTRPALTALVSQFADSSVQKTYHAIVRGLVGSDLDIDLPIGRSRDSSIALRRSTADNSTAAQTARTLVRVLGHGPRATWVECRPKTGRTHQIRVHLEAAGHPVLGDKLYGRPDGDFLAFVARVKAGGDAKAVPAGEPERQLLHAHALEFQHPDGNRRCRLEAPTPACFADWLQRA